MLPTRGDALVGPRPVHRGVTAGVGVNTVGSADEGLGVIGVIPMLALDAVDEQVGHFGVGVHEIPQHHSLLGVLGAPGDNEGVAVGAAVYLMLSSCSFMKTTSLPVDL